MGINPEKDNWLFHAQGYLKLARLCCQELLKPSHHWSEGNSRVPSDWHESFPVGYNTSDLLPGILFTIKHGIELFLKSALIDLGVPNFTSHDTIELFKTIKKIILTTKWKPVYLDTGQCELSEEEIMRISDEVVPRLEHLIISLRENQILNEKLGIAPVPDPKNQLFRYPQITRGNQYDFATLVTNISEEDIKGIILLIDELYEHLNDIGFMFAVDARHKPREK
ncbi:MAG: hypothetical protein PHU04_02050 [Candidatus Peribacteraceae bacterium]|nr:hypothetical protein [Candidatus Peribacteraceae bacterium]